MLLFSTFMGVELIYTDVGDYSLLLWALLALIPIWPHKAHLQPLRQFALKPKYCLHVLHEVSVHWSSTIWKRSRHEEVSVSIESSPCPWRDPHQRQHHFWGGRVEVSSCKSVFLQVPALIWTLFFYSCVPHLGLLLRAERGHVTCTDQILKEMACMCLFYMHALRKLNFIPNSAFLEPHHSVAFTRDPSVEPFTTHVCRLLHLSVDTLGSNAV